MECLYVLGALGWAAAAWKWADWRRFVEFRASIYIFIIGDFLYNILTENRHLWMYVSPKLHLSHNLITAFVAFFTAPLAIMIFLSRYPRKSYLYQALYIAMFVVIYSIHEWIAIKAGIFKHDNHWNLWWSMLLNLIAFPYLRIHQQRPIWGIVLFLVFTLFFSTIFDIRVFDK